MIIHSQHKIILYSFQKSNFILLFNKKLIFNMILKIIIKKINILIIDDNF